MGERDNKGRFVAGNSGAWKPGQSGNPNGKRNHIITYIRKQTDNGEEIVKFLLKVMRGEDGWKTAFKQRLEAGIELLHQSYGKAPVQVELDPGDGENVLRFTMEIGPAGDRGDAPKDDEGDTQPAIEGPGDDVG